MESIIEVSNKSLEAINHLGLSYKLKGLKVKLTPLKNTAVHTPSPKKFDELMQIFELGGWKWGSGDLPTSVNYWNDEKEETCVGGGIDHYGDNAPERFGYARRDFYVSEGDKVITTQKFYDRQKITQEDRNKANEYFEREKPDRKSKGKIN